MAKVSQECLYGCINYRYSYELLVERLCFENLFERDQTTLASSMGYFHGDIVPVCTEFCGKTPQNPAEGTTLRNADGEPHRTPCV